MGDRTQAEQRIPFAQNLATLRRVFDGQIERAADGRTVEADTGVAGDRKRPRQQFDGVGAPVLRQGHLAQVQQTRLIEASGAQGADQC
jgi:hypothetical protein